MTISPGDAPAAPPSAAAPATGTFQRIAGVIMSPASTFEDIARKPNIIGPLILSIVISIVATVLIVPRVDFMATYREALEAQGMTPAQMERPLRMAAAVGKSIAYFGPVIQLVAFAVIAGVLLVAFRMFGGEGDFKQAFSALLYAWVPLFIKNIAGTIVLLTRKTLTLTDLTNPLRSNLAFAVDMKSSPLLFSLLESLDVFKIWTLILLIVGFAAISRLSKARSAAIVITLWVFVVLAKVGGAAIGAARMKK
jgi:hypothetical protein